MGEWICGFKDQGQGEFGFAPANYLKLERRTRSGTPTRVTPTNSSQLIDSTVVEWENFQTNYLTRRSVDLILRLTSSLFPFFIYFHVVSFYLKL